MKKKWRVRDDLVVGQQYGVSTFVSGMAKFRGKKVTLDDNITFEIEEDDFMYDWTPEMFEDEPVSDFPFRRGEEVEVWDKGNNEKHKRIFVGYTPGAIEPYICVAGRDEQKFIGGKKFKTISWKHCRLCRPDLKEGDPVIVWDDPRNKYRRFFAKWLNKKIGCYNGGGNKWSAKGRIVAWNHWRLPTKEELET